MMGSWLLGVLLVEALDGREVERKEPTVCDGHCVVCVELFRSRVHVDR